jgi:outer membrane protein assembly factor BamB
MSPYLTKTRMAVGGPVLMGDRLALGANDGHLYVLDRRTGAEMDRWTFSSPVSAPPGVAGDRLVAASFDGLVACFEVRQER